MPDTYRTQAEADADKAHMLGLARALDVPLRCLRRDECRAWRITGKRGWIYSTGTGAFTVYVAPGPNARRWLLAKEKLPGLAVTQDGDDEGCLRLEEAPGPATAPVLRRILGLTKKRDASPAQLANLISQDGKRDLPTP